MVVNCFHFSVSLGYTTTPIIYAFYFFMLWIAFIFQYLWDTQQQRICQEHPGHCCELLSFFSIFGIHNNFNCSRAFSESVVNCFHFSVSLGYTTTVPFVFLLLILLWIAFIFQYLWDTQQLIKLQIGMK